MWSLGVHTLWNVNEHIIYIRVCNSGRNYWTLIHVQYIASKTCVTMAFEGFSIAVYGNKCMWYNLCCKLGVWTSWHHFRVQNFMWTKCMKFRSSDQWFREFESPATIGYRTNLGRHVSSAVQFSHFSFSALIYRFRNVSVETELNLVVFPIHIQIHNRKKTKLLCNAYVLAYGK